MKCLCCKDENSKFKCSTCAQEIVNNHEIKMLNLTKSINFILKDIQPPHLKHQHFDTSADNFKSLLDTDRKFLYSLKSKLQDKLSYLSHINSSESLVEPVNYNNSIQALPISRRKLVRELLLMFRLRRVEGISDLRIVNVTFSFLDINTPTDKFNAGVGYIIHFTNLLAGYLDVHLPFDIPLNGAKTCVKYCNLVYPLHCTDLNKNEFIVALSLLNYNIAYLCFTQSVFIALDRVHETLNNLAECCQSSQLGCSLDSTFGSTFDLDIDQCIQSLKDLIDFKEVIGPIEDNLDSEWDVL